jgi:hypothetical protein
MSRLEKGISAKAEEKYQECTAPLRTFQSD